MGGSPHTKVFEFLNYFYELYFMNYNEIVDYFLTDDAIYYYYIKNKDFRNCVSAYQRTWRPYYFSNHFKDTCLKKYIKLFLNSEVYSIQIFRYSNEKVEKSSLYNWMIYSKLK